MKKLFEQFRGAALAVAVAMLALLPSEGALAQIVTQLPAPIVANSITDFGNGPLELRVLLGNAWMFTSQGSGTGTSAGTTALTLTATPATPPCIGCIISGGAIPAGTTVTAFNGTTGITTSVATTVTAITVSWGAACPPFANGLPAPNVALQPGGPDLPLFTQSRICGYAANGPGAQIVVFPIGAH